MIVLIFSFSLSDIANYYKNIQINENFEITFYKSKSNRVLYKILGDYYENKEKTIYYGYLPNGSKVKMEFNENYYVYYLDDNEVENGMIEIPIYSPYKMFIFLYENNYPYEVLEKDSLLNVIFNTNGSYWLFLIRADNYKVIQFTSPLKLKINFK